MQIQTEQAPPRLQLLASKLTLFALGFHTGTRAALPFPCVAPVSAAPLECIFRRVEWREEAFGFEPSITPPVNTVLTPPE